MRGSPRVCDVCGGIPGSRPRTWSSQLSLRTFTTDGRSLPTIASFLTRFGPAADPSNAVFVAQTTFALTGVLTDPFPRSAMAGGQSQAAIFD